MSLPVTTEGVPRNTTRPFATACVAMERDGRFARLPGATLEEAGR
jgi:hypothetical protein